MWNPMAKMMGAGLKMLDLDQIEQTVKPTDAQRPAFNDLKAAVATAEDQIRNACPGKPPMTLPGRLEVAEKRFTAMSAGLSAVRPKVDAFYKTLSDDQKSCFNAIRPSHEEQGPQGHMHHRQ